VRPHTGHLVPRGPLRADKAPRQKTQGKAHHDVKLCYRAAGSRKLELKHSHFP